MNWAQARRLDYVDWRLATAGRVQRKDLMRVFGVSLAQAATDLAAFHRAHPDAAGHDPAVDVRATVPSNGRYKRQREQPKSLMAYWADVDRAHR